MVKEQSSGVAETYKCQSEPERWAWHGTNKYSMGHITAKQQRVGDCMGQRLFAKKGPRLWAMSMYCHSLILLKTSHSGQEKSEGR